MIMAFSFRIITVVISLTCKYLEASGQPQKGECQDKELGMRNGYILDKDITASSVQNTSAPAKNARLNYTEGSSWCAAANDSKPYLQIELNRLYIICAVSTQGNSQGDQWVNTYTLQSSKDGATWTDYQEAGKVKVFNGNFDQNTTVKQVLCNAIVATRLRIVAQDHHGNCCIRVEFHGLPVRRDNLAQGKPAAQSSTVSSWYSDYAVDGSTGTFWCAATDSSTNPWWRVDLEEFLPVSDIFILSGFGGLNGFEIRVGNEVAEGGSTNQLCASGLIVPKEKGTVFRCNFTVYGRYVYIRIPEARRQLKLCEVEVYSSSYPNYALNQPAMQSTTDGKHEAESAVDGNFMSWSMTNYQREPWWRVDLGSSLPVAEIVVHTLSSFVNEIRIGEFRAL